MSQVEKVILTAKFQKRNAANQLADVVFVNGTGGTVTSITGSGINGSAAESDISNQLANLGTVGATQAQDAADAASLLNA